MRHSICLGCFVLVGIAVTKVAFAEPDESAKTAALKAAAQEFLDALLKEDCAAATKNFDETMQKAMPQDKLE